MELFLCPSCGAEIVTDATTAATYCYYCHNPVVLSGRLSGEFLPNKVLPFAIEKEEAIKQFLAETSEKPDALFAANDALAIGALKAIQESGYRVPKDIAVIGFNDSSVAKYVTPALSTIKVYTEWLGEIAVETILQLIQTEAPVPRKIVVGTDLIVRESA